MNEPSKLLENTPTQLLLDGEWVPSVSGRRFATKNPATDEVLAEVAEAGITDVDLAVAAARRSFEDGRWSRLKPSIRARILWRAAELIEAKLEELSILETLDNGKPISDARKIDVPQAAAHFFYHSGWCTKLEGATIPVSWPGHLNYTVREPVGVVGQITPWNFPLIMAARNVAPALAAGNSIVLKPSEETPLSALLLGEILLQAGVPDGVVNIVPGFGDVAGAHLAGHPDVDKISFTGGHDTARRVIEASARNFKRLTLELGGKAPSIILEDADLEAAIRGAIAGAFHNQGQNCCAASRLYVSQNIRSDFMAEFADRVRAMQLGNGLDADTELGPLISPRHLARVEGYVTSALREGAELVVGGERPGGRLGKGYFFRPSVLEGASEEMEVSRDEVFGPVVVVHSFEDLDEVAGRANDTPYGLAAGIWTSNISKAHALARRLQAGTVWINCWERFDAASPFGGFKQSGYGRATGRQSVEEYTQIKSVWVDESAGLHPRS